MIPKLVSPALGSKLKGMLAPTALGALIAPWLLSGCASGFMEGLAYTSPEDLAKRGDLVQGPELEKLVQGANVTRRHPDGYVHTWTNRQDGTFVAHTASSFTWGNGTWSIFDNQYCISIRWITKDNGYIGTESGCNGVYAMDGKTYYAPTPISVSRKGARYSEIRFD